MKLCIVALLLVACVAYTNAVPAPEPFLDLGGLLGGILNPLLTLVGGLVSGLLAGVLATLGKVGLLGIDLSALKGLSLITGLLDTVTTLVSGLPIVGELLGPVTVSVAGVVKQIIGALPIDLNKLPTDPNVLLTLVCPLLGVLGAVVAVLASVAGLAVGVVGAVVTLAVSVTAGLPLLGTALAGLPGLIGANVVQLININVLVNALCAKPPQIAT